MRPNVSPFALPGGRTGSQAGARRTPAMAAGVTDHAGKIEDIVALLG
jgi:hypothetical protein